MPLRQNKFTNVPRYVLGPHFHTPTEDDREACAIDHRTNSCGRSQMAVTWMEQIPDGGNANGALGATGALRRADT